MGPNNVTIPSPRADLQATAHQDTVRIRDPLTGQHTLLGPQSAAIWHALHAGPHTPCTLQAALPHFTPARLQARLRQMATSTLLADARFEAQRALLDSPAPRPLTPPAPTLPKALRHACVRCGASCTAVQAGPVTPATVRAVVASGVWEDVPGLTAAEQLFEAPGGNPIMARNGEACVALRDGACALQAGAGDAVKPASCHQFPYTVTHTPSGPRLSLQVECRQLLACLDAGAELDAPSVAAQHSHWASEAGTAFTAPDPLQLAPGLFMPLTRLMPRWDALIEAEGGLPQAQALVAELIATHEAALPAQFWLDDAHWGHPPAPDAAAAQTALWTALSEACAQAAEDAEGANLPWTAVRYARLGRVIETRQSSSPVQTEAPELTRLRHVAALADLAGLEPLRRRDLQWGIGRLSVMLALGEGWARAQAAEATRAKMLAQDLNDGLVVASMALRSPRLEHAMGVHADTVRQLART
jgi:hypothetical protein